MSESDQSEYEDLTPADIYMRLKISWMNQKTAPEILQNDEDITEVSFKFILVTKNNNRTVFYASN